MLTLPSRSQVATAAVLVLCVGLVLSCFSGNWQYLGLALPLDRPFVLGGTIALLAIEPWRPPFSRIAVLMAAVLVWILVCTAVAGTITLDGIYGALDQVVVPYALLLCGAQFSASNFRRKAVLVTVTAIGAYCGLLAVVETLHVNALILPRYIDDPLVGLHFGRARGPFVESAADGLTLTYAFVTASILTVAARRRRNRIVASAVAALCFAGTILTLTRECWIGVVLAAVILFILVRPLRRRLAVGLIGVVAAGALAFVATPLGAALTDRSGDLSPVWDRLNTNAAAFRIVYANPVFGIGYGNAIDEIGQYVRLAPTYPVTAESAHLQPHNVLLGRASELGVPGFLLWAAVVVVALVGVVRGRRSTSIASTWCAVSVAVLVAWGIAINLSPVAFALPNYLPFLFVGIALGVQRGGSEEGLRMRELRKELSPA